MSYPWKTMLVLSSHVACCCHTKVVVVAMRQVRKWMLSSASLTHKSSLSLWGYSEKDCQGHSPTAKLPTKNETKIVQFPLKTPIVMSSEMNVKLPKNFVACCCHTKVVDQRWVRCHIKKFPSNGISSRLGWWTSRWLIGFRKLMRVY